MALQRPWPLVLALLALLLVMVGACAPDPTLEIAPGSARTDWTAQIQDRIAASGYAPQPIADGFRIHNRAQAFDAVFTRQGVRVGELGLSLRSWGREGSETTVEGVSIMQGDCGSLLNARGDCFHRLTYTHPGITEWWENRPDGLEQGFTVDTPSGDEALVIDLAIDGAVAEIEGDATAARIGDLRYSGLLAWDETGRDLPAWMEEVDGGLRLLVDDAGAVGQITVDPLLTAASWTMEPNLANTYFGNPASSAGDVNGDGFGDVIVGASGYSHGQSLEGGAFLYLGSATGLATTAAWSAESDQADARFGYPVSSAGDVNGDGYGDVVVGAHYWTNGQTNEGSAFLYLGSATGLASTAAWMAESDQASAFFGVQAASAGDVNGDGYGDVLVGAYKYDNGQTDEGRVYVYLGSASGLSATASILEADQGGEWFGKAAASAGDVNGDGYADVVVGSPNYGNGENVEGCAYVYLGSATGLAANASWTAEANVVSTSSAYSVSSAGDVNGDGYGDVVVGAPDFDNGQTNEGAASLYLGSATGLATAASWTAESGQADAMYGYSVSSAGDVNGDGFGDMVVGAPDYDNGQTDEGRAYLYLGSGAVLASTAAWIVESNRAYTQYGYSLSSAGDVNGDGYGDLVVGAWQWDNGQTDEGGAFLYLGSSSGFPTTASWTTESNQTDAWFGWSVSSAGDINADGYGDVVVGAIYFGNGQTHEGRSYLYLGSTTGLATTASWTAEGDQADANLGDSVSSAGDVNGDGYGDVVVGAYQYTNGQTNEGRALLYLGSVSGLSTTASWSVESNKAGANFGFSTSSAGDVNGDGYGDVLVGAANESNGQTTEGRAYLYLGSATGLATYASWTTESDQTNALYGCWLSSAGDVNGDGYGDVVVGAYLYDNGQTDEGRAWLYLGSATGLASTAAWTAEADQSTAWFGTSTSAGDVNGDGYGDLLVGADTYGNGQFAEGRAFLYLGSASGLASTAAWTAESDQVGGTLGRSIATVDINGDGYCDVVASADYYDNPEISEGRIYMFLGNGADNTGRGLSLTPQARRPGSSTPISPGLVTPSTSAFDVAMTARGPWGRSPIKVQVEVKPLGAPFDGTGLVTQSSYTSSGLTGTSITQSITGLADDTGYHWRARVLVSPATGQKQGWGPWKYGGISGSAQGGHVFTSTVWYADTDGDGYGDPTFSTSGSEQPPGFVADDTDCDDTLAAVNPGHGELCSTTYDDDCDGVINEATATDAPTWYRDADGDTYGISTTTVQLCGAAPAGYVSSPADCNDTDVAIHPGVAEIVADGIDQDCDGQETCYADADNDNYRLISTIPSTDADCTDSGEALATDPSGDCNDTVAAAHPGATEITADGIDEDCDGGETCHVDADNDNFRLSSTMASTDADCLDSGEALATDPGGDCNDADATIHPSAVEIVGDEVDQTCDGLEICHVDADNDNYRLTSTVVSTDTDCTDSGEAPANDPTGDCNDANAALHPGAAEIVADGIDQDCDGQDACYVDADDDGYRLDTTVASTDSDCMDAGEAPFTDPTGDCDDVAATVHPGATEITGNGVDENCDGVELCHVDADNDDFRLSGTVASADGDCSDPGEALATDSTGDCDDANAAIHPGADEICDDANIDEDCDGLADDASATDQSTWYLDADGDGFGVSASSLTACDPRVGYSTTGTDCDDTDATVNPSTIWYRDSDSDGFGDLSVTTTACSLPTGHASDSTDCDDNNASIHPGATEICDPADVDENCDGLADDASATGQSTWYLDVDGDGSGVPTTSTAACNQPTGYASTPTDCDDNNAAIHPNTPEVCDPSDMDEDCDGLADDADPSVSDRPIWYLDADGDGYGDTLSPVTTCDLAPGHAATPMDCDDLRPDVNPDATELCNALDDDCDGFADGPDAADAPTWYLDADTDGWGSDTTTQPSCTQPVGYSPLAGDCNDANTAMHPGASESDCKDPSDYNCDGSSGTADIDADGFPACEDCDDRNAVINPDATETCNAIDDDCSGSVDDNAADAMTWYPDADVDFYGSAAEATVACVAPSGTILYSESLGDDCDDENPAVHPGAAEVCGKLDDDCDGAVDEAGATGEATWYADADADGFADSKDIAIACIPPEDYIAASKLWDCDDSDTAVNPDAIEACNAIDDDCDGFIDEEGATGETLWYADVDGDGFGDATSTQADCEQPKGYVGDASDCDDSDASIYAGADEIPGDGIDQDCDGVDQVLDSGDSGPIDDSGKTDTGSAKEGGCGGCASTRGSGSLLLAMGLLGVLIRRRR